MLIIYNHFWTKLLFILKYVNLDIYATDRILLDHSEMEVCVDSGENIHSEPFCVCVCV